MERSRRLQKPARGAPLFVVSGGMGASGELLARTVLAQFQDARIPIVVKARIHEEAQINQIIAEAAATDGVIVHTLVDPICRQALLRRAECQGVFAIDLVGPLLAHLSEILQQEPLGRPGLYRRLNETYFKRIEAIEFAVAHDDGKRIDDLPQAEIILIGVSRVGKTPLSMYLSMLGWKVANVPFVMEIPLPDALGRVDRRRVFGLMIEPHQLAHHRRTRQPRLGVSHGAYFERTRIAEELRAANHLFYKQRFTTIDVTDKPIETIADEIETLLSGIA